ncbi:ABC-type antimicrobial peptide transport system, permease component [Hyella patelloides LEGE 07179]|uniref:ABC-type antimicrobial peptide transport system, permease component n=1 Tax=Hyella patelloides LEGE 07179 TaxID=945734 RepID=A0A563W595_9CYAN|nr:ABC transporter permease [Hyella patelloides]VEP18848.1 ABC-type antimicrobial peptide transport system, permease component [Hyella patelloides LEGE 07179]
MKFLESVRMSVSTLTAHKMRSSLTMLGIIIGNASVIGMVGIGQAAQKLAEDQFASLGPNVLFIVPGSDEERRTTFNLPKTLVLEDAEAIAEQVPTVNEVAPQINSNQLITYRDRNSNELVVGATPTFLSVRSFVIDKGRFINDVDLKRNNRVIVLGPEIADKLFPQQDALGEQIRVKNISFEVIGIMEAKGSFLGTNQDTSVYIPITTMANQLVGDTSPFGTQVNFISVTARDENSIRAASFQIENLLRLRHKIVDRNDFTVRSQKDVLEIVGTVTDGLTILLAAIAGISLLVGGIGVMNIMLVSVTERTQEIGLRKAIGAQEEDILTQFLIEATILSALGGVIGTGIGVSTIMLVGAVSPLTAAISPVAIMVAVTVSGGIGLSFGVLPAKRAAKLDPIVALRSA